MNNASKITIIIIALLVVGGLMYYFLGNRQPLSQNPQGNNSTTTGTTTQNANTISYRNEKYGFSITLPKSWTSYTVVEGNWSGDSLNSKGEVVTGTVSGPMVSIRHPQWSSTSPRQDIPVMVFTIDQWNEMQADKFHIGAAPINPSELGRNSKYVFALPARYNFSYLTGYEEVDQIVQNKNNFQTF